MNYQQTLYKLKEALRQRLPKGTHARELSRILGISENGVGRKLRGTVKFSFEDMIKISDALHISLDSLLTAHTPVPATTAEILDLAGQAENSRFTAVCKNIPLISHLYFRQLMKFAILKGKYFNNSHRPMHPINKNSFQSIRQLVFIVDSDMIRNYTLELLFFRKNQHISTGQVKRILDDLNKMLLKMEEICNLGYLPSSGQQTTLYYSDYPLYNNIHLIESRDINTALSYISDFNPIINNEPQTFQLLKQNVNTCISNSNPISGTDELNRIIFFKKQHRIIEEFRNNISWADFFSPINTR